MGRYHIKGCCGLSKTNSIFETFSMVLRVPGIDLLGEHQFIGVSKVFSCPGSDF